MKHNTRQWASFVAVISLCATSAYAQAPPAASKKLEATSSSAEAKAAFWAALDDANNVFPARAEVQAKKAVTLDPTFGLARVFYGSIATGLTDAQVEQELNRGVADAAKATTGELLMAAAIRANQLGRANEAMVLTDAAVALMPEDANVAFFRAGLLNVAQQPAATLEVTKKFPSFAPAFNLVAYQQWNEGDRTNALQSVQQYVRLAPNHPNSHDSFAELLQFSGRYADALPHYVRAAELDPTFADAFAGQAEVHLLLGHPAQARPLFAQAAAKAATPAAAGPFLIVSATTYLLENKPKDAVRELAALAAAAEQQNLRPQAAATHRNLALVEAAFGDRKAAAPHLAKSAELGGADAAAQHRFTALVNALTGQLDAAKAAAAKFDQAAAAGTPAQRNNAHEVNAVIAIAEKNVERAQSELAQAGPAPFGRALLAEALKKAGKQQEAQAIKAELQSSGTATFFDVLARAKIQKI